MQENTMTIAGFLIPRNRTDVAAYDGVRFCHSLGIYSYTEREAGDFRGGSWISADTEQINLHFMGLSEDCFTDPLEEYDDRTYAQVIAAVEPRVDELYEFSLTVSYKNKEKARKYLENCLSVLELNNEKVFNIDESGKKIVVEIIEGRTS